MKKLVPVAIIYLCATAPAMADDKDKKGGMSHEQKIEHHFREKDSNNDGTISKAEHDAATQKMFDEADTNNDNQVSKDEFRAHKQKEKSKMSSDTTTIPGGEMNPAAGSSSGSAGDKAYKPN
jgi:hypothetical protein